MAAVNNVSFYRQNISCSSLSLRGTGEPVSTRFNEGVMLGALAGRNLSTASSYSCTAVGDYSLYSAANGTTNATAFGYGAGSAATLPNSCTFIGSGSNVAGTAAADSVIAVGYQAKGDYSSISIGNLTFARTSCVVVGHGSGDNDMGGNNVAVGNSAFRNISAAITNCVALGTLAMGLSAKTTTAPSGTVAVGYGSLATLTTGVGNTAVGYSTGAGISTGSYNTILGYNASSGNISGCVALGYGVSPTVDSFSVAVGGLSPKTFSTTFAVTAGGAVALGAQDSLAVTINGSNYKIALYSP